MPYTAPTKHRSASSSSSSSCSSCYSSSSSSSSPSSPTAILADAKQTPERSLPVPSTTHHAPRILTPLCDGVGGARTLRDVHTAARASIAPPLHQPLKCQYRGVDGISTSLPPLSNEARSFLEKDKTSKDLMQLASRLLRSNCSQVSHALSSRDQKANDCDGRPGFSVGVFSHRHRTSESGYARELMLTHSIKESHASTTSRQSTTDKRDEALRERRKSLEPVRPAIRPSHSYRRSASLPASPKAVHFNPLEDVRYFNKSERPIAVSAGSSPVIDRSLGWFESPALALRLPPFEWELSMPNFPHPTMSRNAMPVRLDRVSLSSENTALLGTVVVANLAYHKSVVCRFTLDFWNTISEVTAQHFLETAGHDIFTFCIDLAELVDLELKPMFFCIRYNVNGQEFWDNNSSLNFQADFKKKYLW